MGSILRKTKSSALVFPLLLWLPAILYAQDDLRAYTLAASCTACHGTDGNSPGSIPALAGKTAAYIAGKLKEFKSDGESPAIMNRLAQAYSDEEIDRIAEWFEAHGR